MNRNLALIIGGALAALLLGFKFYINNMENIQLSKNFTLGEFMRSNKAAKLGIPNIPSKVEIERIRKLVVNVLQPLRNYFGLPIKITSGGRVHKLNEAVGGAANSQHLHWEAADFVINGIDNTKIMNAAKELNLPVDQMIDERLYNEDGKLITWIHVSHDNNNRKDYLLARNSKDDLRKQFYRA